MPIFNDFFATLFLLYCGHFLCDFALQSDWMAKAKNPFVDGVFKNNDIWLTVLIAHSMIHAGATLLISGSTTGAIIVLVTHIVIDYLKCAGKMSFSTDQVLHLAVMLLVAALTFI